MAFSFDGTTQGDSVAGGPLGQTSTIDYGGAFFGSDPELLVVIVEQDNLGSAITLTAPAGWTVLETVDLGNGVAYWFGYKMWTSGDPTTFDWYTTGEAIFVSSWFAGGGTTNPPLYGQRSVPAAEDPIATPSFADPMNGLANVFISAGCRYGQTGTGNGWGLVDETDLNSENVGSGGGPVETGKSCVIGYTIPGGFGPFHFTPRRRAITTDSQAFTFGAVFFVAAPPATGGLVWGVIPLG